jgi:hypothetical protein
MVVVDNRLAQATGEWQVIHAQQSKKLLSLLHYCSDSRDFPDYIRHFWGSISGFLLP